MHFNIIKKNFLYFHIYPFINNSLVKKKTLLLGHNYPKLFCLNSGHTFG